MSLVLQHGSTHSQGTPLLAEQLPEGCRWRRELTHFKGEQDPFKGDVPNQRVRDLAKEALDAVFAPTDLNPSTAAAPLQAWDPPHPHAQHTRATLPVSIPAPDGAC